MAHLRSLIYDSSAKALGFCKNKFISLLNSSYNEVKFCFCSTICIFDEGKTCIFLFMSTPFSVMPQTNSKGRNPIYSELQMSFLLYALLCS